MMPDIYIIVADINSLTIRFVVMDVMQYHFEHFWN